MVKGKISKGLIKQRRSVDVKPASRKLKLESVDGSKGQALLGQDCSFSDRKADGLLAKK
jgi:hypothetical protein